MITKLYEKLAVVAYPVMFGNQKIKIWREAKDHLEKKPFEYQIDEKLTGLLITDAGGAILAEDLDDINAINFLEADMGMGSPVAGAQVVFSPGSREISEGTKRVIRQAAERYGSSADSILDEIKSRKSLNRKVSGTVKKKRKIDLADLDLDD
jgi:hypothetical protein